MDAEEGILLRIEYSKYLVNIYSINNIILYFLLLSCFFIFVLENKHNSHTVYNLGKSNRYTWKIVMKYGLGFGALQWLAFNFRLSFNFF